MRRRNWEILHLSNFLPLPLGLRNVLRFQQKIRRIDRLGERATRLALQEWIRCLVQILELHRIFPLLDLLKNVAKIVMKKLVRIREAMCDVDKETSLSVSVQVKTIRLIRTIQLVPEVVLNEIRTFPAL